MVASVKNYSMYQVCFDEDFLATILHKRVESFGASIQNNSMSQVCLDKDLLAIISHKIVVPYGCIHLKLF